VTERYRWIILAVGSLATASYSSTRQGLPALSPQLSSDFGLSLSAVGLVLGSAGIGQLLMTYTWGSLVDRHGERLVLGIGLTGAALALALGAFAPGVPALVAALTVTGMLGASATTASGRAVMAWFPRHERGTALGLRQMALPLGGATAALWLPAVVAGASLRAALLALAALMLVGGAVSALAMREPAEPAAPTRGGRAPLRDPQLWRLAGCAAALVSAQVSILGFLVLFLHRERGLSAASAAVCLAVVQFGGAAARPLAGRWSDRRGQRIPQMRAIAFGSALLLGLSAVCAAGAPLALALVALLPAGILSMSWNGLAFAAAAEMAGVGRAGAALGIQNTVVSLGGGVMPPLFGLLVEGVGWSAAFAVLGSLQVAAAVGLSSIQNPMWEEARSNAAAG
jgi:sugar phosphate permease